MSPNGRAIQERYFCKIVVDCSFYTPDQFTCVRQAYGIINPVFAGTLRRGAIK